MSKRMEHQKSLRIVYFICLVDYLSAAITLPIFPILFLTDAGILPLGTSLHTRTLLFGISISIFILGDFVASCFAPKLSDSLGRKNVLFPLLTLGCIGSIGVMFGILTKNIWILLISRCITGLGGSTTAVAKAIISDVSTEKTRLKNFMKLGVIYPVSFILGPVLGTLLSDSKIISWFNFTRPFQLISLLYLICLSITFILKETGTKKHKELIPNVFQIFLKYFKQNDKRLLFTWILFYTLGWALFFTMLPVFLITKFHVDHEFIGLIYTVIGIWMVIANLFLVKPTLKKFHVNRVILIASASLFVIFSLFFIFENYLLILLFFFLPFIGMLQNIMLTGISMSVSGAVPGNYQGEIQGMSSSVRTIANGIAPLLGGYLISYHLPLPFTFSAFFVLVTYIFIKKYENHSKSKA